MSVKSPSLSSPEIAYLSLQDFCEVARKELAFVYGDQQATTLMERLEKLVIPFHEKLSEPQSTEKTPSSLWSEKSQILITYGGSILPSENDDPPLKALYDFINSNLKETFSGIHVLPFFPWSSDDGFSVVDYLDVNPDLGDWEDIQRIGNQYQLMADLVLNHISRESLWFTDYLSDSLPGKNYFIELPQETDVSMVTRPRATPLLVPVYTRRGKRFIWATFSKDQIDLNYANPDVLFEMLKILLTYLEHGVRIVRLDAVAFMWKELGTTCIHLPQTHALIRLFRAVINYVAPSALLVTETNVPHKENLSYFGNLQQGQGPEANMVYQFTLPPLLVHTLTSGDVSVLNEWAASLPELPEDCTYFNFTASHDGIGVRALEGLLPSHDIDQLLNLMKRFGGYISMKANSDGTDSPYEINITYFDALKGTRKGEDPWQIIRFICSQVIMLGLQGIPGVYVHSMTGTANAHNAVSHSGQLRSINRKKWNEEDLYDLLSATTPTRFVFKAMSQILNKRRNEPCFHPSVRQTILDFGEGIFAFQRGPMPNGRTLIAIYNVTDEPKVVRLPECFSSYQWEHLLGFFDTNNSQGCKMKPYYSTWLVGSEQSDNQ